MTLAVCAQQISHYHNARFTAVADAIPGLTVVSAANGADFKEFLSTETPRYPVMRLFEDMAAYRAAVPDGTVWRRTQEALSRIDPRVVAVTGWTVPESLAAIAWARARGRGVVVMSASQAHDGPRNPFREWIKSRVVRACDAALVAAGPHRDYAVRLGIAVARVFLGYDAVDNDAFARGADAARANASALRRAHGLPARYLLASARFIAKKNLPALIEAYGLAARAVADPPDLVLLGDGPMRGAVEAAVARHETGKGRVHLPGFKTYAELPIFYGLAEGFVHVSLTEQWGLVVNEAAAAGLPLLVSRPCGAAAELVAEGENGFLVDPASLDDMTGALIALMSLSPDGRAAMQRASRRRVADWGPDRFARGLSGACAAAAETAGRTLSPLDGALLRVLSRRLITTVE